MGIGLFLNMIYKGLTSNAEFTAIWRIISLTLFLYFFRVYFSMYFFFFKMSAGPWHFHSVPVDSCLF